MELIKTGQEINIKRTNGCIHPATVVSLHHEQQCVTVEWSEQEQLRGKEIPWSAVLQHNPSIADQLHLDQDKLQVVVRIVPTIAAATAPPTPINLSMYNKKPGNSPYNRRLRPALANANANCKSTNSIKPASLMKASNKALANKNSSLKPNQLKALPKRQDSNTMPCSNVVHVVERLKEQRERRRALQAEQRREKNVLMSKDPDNPNWEVALMVREYRDQLVLRPLRNISPRGARTQQITVCVRKRPMSLRDREAKSVDIISVPTLDSLIVHELRNKVDLTKLLDHHRFRFDYTFDEGCSNKLVYEYTARPLIRTMFEGGNATCFAYGQTGSGKTHTMSGEFSGKSQDCTTGIYALAARDVFEMHKKDVAHKGAQITCSYFEIYGSKVFDLLVPGKPQLRVLEDGRQQVVIVGLTRTPVSKVDEIMQLIERGNRVRTSGQTSVNIKSSRSHAIFQIGLVKPGDWEPCGKCSFVDLAGNERGADTQSASLQTRREGAEINKSLLALKECIRAMSRHSTHLPFRGSKLTQVLRDSFIGGQQNKTCMIAMISPGLGSVENTLNTLRYADRVKALVAKEDELTPMQQLKKTPRYSPEYNGTDNDSVSSYNEVDKTVGKGEMEACDSVYNIDLKEDSPEMQLMEIIVQQEALFKFVGDCKQNFDQIVNSLPFEQNESLLKYVQDVEPAFEEMKQLVEQAQSLVANFNALQYAQGDNKQQ
ncbi:Klp59D [Drosophila busckii]|uniref:Klp59D n=1 Tax=Drosophila busckii TaxID=30019 RepID=A0A0M3QTY2_DROBS|nr:Klp59D [Drosophila busckii]